MQRFKSPWRASYEKNASHQLERPIFPIVAEVPLIFIYWIVDLLFRDTADQYNRTTFQTALNEIKYALNFSPRK